MDSMESSPQKKIGSGPKTRVCYVCGRQYGLHSFEIHLKQCKELWIAREAEKDPRERRKLPEDPMLRLSVTTSISEAGSPVPSAKDLEEINRLSSAAFNNEALLTCAHCGRTFLPEKLAIHNRSCTAENPARRANETVKRGNASSAASTPAATPSKSEMNTPVRPNTGSRPRSSLAARNSTERPSEPDDEGVTHLRVDDGNLVGHLGGSSGRPLRSNKSPGIASPQPQERSRPSSTSLSVPNGSGPLEAGTLFNISDFRDKEEVIDYLTKKLDGLENIATDLARAIIDIRTVVDQLR